MQSPAVESTTISYHCAAGEMTGRQRTAQRDNTQCLHPYRDSRPTTLSSSSAPHTFCSPALSPEDLESVICQSETTTHSGRADPPKITDYLPEEIEVIESARRKVVMDMLMTIGWNKNSTKKQKQSMHKYAREVVDEVKVSLDYPGPDTTSAVTTLVIQGLTYCRSRLMDNAEKECPPHYRDWFKPQDKSLSVEARRQYMRERKIVTYDSNVTHTYFLHAYINGRLVLFSHGGLAVVHLKTWYLDESSPLFDNNLRPMLTTTTCPMLSMSAIAVMCFIDRYVEGRLSKSGNVLRFASNPYADKYHNINKSMEAASNSDLHREPMKSYFQYLHDKGIRLLSDKLGLTSPTLIYIPTSLDELEPPSEAVNPATSHNAVSRFPVLPQREQTGPSATWSSAALYAQEGFVADQSALALYSEAEGSTYTQSDMYTPLAQESYTNLSMNSVDDLSLEAAQGTSSGWSGSSETTDSTFWSDPDVIHTRPWLVLGSVLSLACLTIVLTLTFPLTKHDVVPAPEQQKLSVLLHQYVLTGVAHEEEVERQRRHMRDVHYDAVGIAENGNQDFENGHQRVDVIEETEPTEITPLIPQHAPPAPSGEEQDAIGWWIAQLLVVVLLSVIPVSHITVIVLFGMNQTFIDGTSPFGVVIYAVVSMLALLVVLPLAPFSMDMHRWLNGIILTIFILSTLYTNFAFPFSQEMPLKVYFAQSVDLDMSRVVTALTGPHQFLSTVIIPRFLSAFDQALNCTDALDKPDLQTCKWAVGDVPSLSRHYGQGPTVLPGERDTVHYVTLQKDIDLKDLHTRLDKMTKQLSQIRVSLIGAESSKVHLQERVDQLACRLQGNEEKLAVYERRPSVANGAASPTEQDLPREQQLRQEVAELRSALKVAQVNLTAACSHMQQFQEISQANEVALSALNAAHDQYKTETEAQISKNELEYKALQDKLRSVDDDAIKGAACCIEKDAERDKCGFVDMINRLKEDATQHYDEVQSLRNSIRQARQKHQTQETRVRKLRSSETCNNAFQDRLTQQLQLAQSDIERETA
ncbi:hypothetical protein EV702DRAFT_1200386 [Suillus placidus]|uniref:Uncharacterized protein n=1 Tax=Suillus placidus TaxID=48579 RepID=A0A9P6ZPZ2_9AGAM|nr:hypothetical protein EV702DRAFT_1200386 [Suillus placidus]